MNSCAKRCKFYGVLFAVMFVAISRNLLLQFENRVSC